MIRRILCVVMGIFCISLAIAEYSTLIHHKDGRVFSITTEQIDSITHTKGCFAESAYILTDSIVYPPYTNAMMGVLLQATAGVANSTLCSNENISALFSQNAKYEREGEQWTHSGMFTLIDDDVVDEFIPSSYPAQSISGTDKKVGGYFSLLYPFLKSLEVKYGVELTCGLSVEGQRVGMTKYWAVSDECAINENGQLVQQITSYNHWDCLCHSMTARLAPMSPNVFLVDSLTSSEAQDILANGKWDGKYSFYTASVYDLRTKKNYFISQDRTYWVEMPRKYIQPYYFNQKTGKWIYNETYPVDYQVGEWKSRATQLGFTYPDIMVHWGSTASAQMIRETRKYFSHSIDPGMDNGVNNVPLSATIHRINAITTGNSNAYNATYYKALKSSVDNAFTTHGWLVFMSHFNTIYYYNGYLNGVTYTDKDENYNAEWTNPLITEEIRSMDDNNYWENPPARLGITNWGEWYPAKGTQLWALYNVFAYAIEKGLQNVSPSEGVKIMGNKVNIGTYRDKDFYPREKSMDLKPIDKCYYVVGADGSIKYQSIK